MALSIDQILKEGNDAYKEGKLKEAEHLYLDIIKTHPKHPDANHNLGLIAISMDKEDVALSLFKTATENNPNIEQYWHSYANALMSKNQLQLAKSCYEKVILLNPESSINYFNLGVVYKKLDSLDKAQSNFKKAIELKPDYFKAFFNLGFIQQQLGELKNAETSYKKAIELKPDYAIAYFNLGTIFHTLDEYEEAKNNYTKAIESNSEYFEAYNNLGVVFHTTRKLEEAETYLRKSIKLNPKFAESHNNLGFLLQDIGKLEEAEMSIKKAINLMPNLIDAQTNLGGLMIYLGKLNEAEEILKKALILDPTHIQTLDNLKIASTYNELLLKIKKKKKFNFKSLIGIKDSPIRLSTNPFISKRKVEDSLITELHKIKTRILDNTAVNSEIFIRDGRYGNGKCSDFMLFENNSPIIKNVSDDLIKIMSKAVNSEIFIIDSFFNILKAGGGTIPHNHVSLTDHARGLSNHKYSLTYYLSVGDQNCNEPGNLILYDPKEEIILSDGKIVIIPGTRMHNAVYGGKLDRVMIGVNFYSIL